MLKNKEFIQMIIVVFFASLTSAMYDMVFALITGTDPDQNMARFESIVIVFSIVSIIAIAILYGSKRKEWI